MPARWSTPSGPGPSPRSRPSTPPWPPSTTSELNAFSHLDVEAARATAAGGRRLAPLRRRAARDQGARAGRRAGRTPRPRWSSRTGWPTHDSTQVTRLRAAGAVLAGQTTASEFGGINCTSTKLHGTTRNPWNPERTPGGSSGGSAAAVAGGLAAHRQRRRRRRLDPHPGRVHRPVRPQVDLRADPPGPRDPAASPHRGGRLRVALGAGHGPLVRRVQRLRPPRHPEPAPGGGLGGRPRLLRPGRQAGGRLASTWARPSSSPGRPPWSSRRPRP